MSLEKTTRETNRDFTDLEKTPVYENLPAYFEQEYPKFTQFLEKYYDQEDTSFADLRDLEFKRDFVAVEDELLRFFSQELLLGRDYFDKLIDKRTAIQISNLLYRSKGTKYAIQQFFRVFFGFDVDIRYGRDEVFLVGDPYTEELVYTSELRNGNLFPGNRMRFTFDDGEIQVLGVAKLPQEKVTEGLYVETSNDTNPYAEDQNDYVEAFVRELEYNVYFPLRQDIDYTILYSQKLIELQPIPDGYDPVYDDPWLNELAETGIMPEDMQVKILIKRYDPAGSPIGPEVSDKRITNNGFWQLFSLSLRTPISIKRWRQAYKDFVHPAGMFLEGQVLVQSSDKLIGTQPDVILEEYRKPAFSEDELLERVEASITELNILPFEQIIRGYNQSGYVTNDRSPFLDVDSGGLDSAGAPVYAEERLDSEGGQDLVYRTRINDIKTFSDAGFTMEEIDTQYQRMDRIDTIEARTLDNVEADLSNTINTVDENKWYGDVADLFCQGVDSDYAETILGSQLDFPGEVPGCPGYIFNLFGTIFPLKGYSSTGQNFHIVNGVADQKFTAYRDERVWGTTVGNNFSDPFNADSAIGFPGDADYANPFQYSIVNGIAANVRTYFLSGFVVDAGDIGPGDSADYMADIIFTDSA